MKFISIDNLDRFRNLFVCIFLIITFFVYDPWRFENTSGDTISARYWPVSILKYDTFTLNPWKDELADVSYFAINRKTTGDLLPRNGYGMAPLTVPFYFVVDAFDLGGTEWTHNRISHVARWNGIFLALFSLFLLYLLLAKFAPWGIALASTALFAFGTWHLSLGAQGLHPQSSCVFLHIASFFCLWELCTSRDQKRTLFAAAGLAFFHAWVWSIRPQDVFLMAPAFLIVLEKRRAFIYLSVIAAILFPLTLSYMREYYSPLGFYGVVNTASAGVKNWQLNGFKGFLGLLFSPNRGAIVFFPLLFIIPFLWKKLVPDMNLKNLFGECLKLKFSPLSGSSKYGIPENFAGVLVLSSVAYFISLCFIVFWHNTWSYGARFLYDFQPFLWPFVTVLIWELWKWIRTRRSALHGVVHVLVVYCMLQGIFVHVLGHRNNDLYVWNSKFGNVGDDEAWNFNDLMLVDVWKAGSNKGRWDDALKRLHEKGY